MNLSRYVKNRNIDIPMMISGITKENSIRKFAPAGAGPRQRDMPIANATPSGTAMNMVRNDRRRLWISAARNSGLTNSAPVGSNFGCPHHHWNENPCQTEFDRPALNEIPMAMSTGSSDHARYTHVAVARMWGLRHGFRHQPSGDLVLVRTEPAASDCCPGRPALGRVLTVSLIAVSAVSAPSLSRACSRASG